jgi:hypothetical protein
MLRDSDILVFDIEPQAIERAHIDVRNPYQGKLSDDITPPSETEHFKLRQEQEKGRYIVAEAILASEEIEEFAQVEWCTVLTFVFAEVSGLSKDFLMSDSPGDACSCKAE